MIPKKEPYIGDPTATPTICTKKLRRHLSRDLMYLPVPVKVDPSETGEVTADKPTMTVVVICKHCNQDPVRYDLPTKPEGEVAV